ncbi:cysteine desulfurase family protein [Pedobacter sp. AJM]|uniref:cysteine desulfurase family protein n=1 Tax=Pedobacter sp. AJM TaxID=2003629 RepID=UPI000B4B4FE4|nr:cysteine desulfurase family protein [Pedobacter sp. AJM]OWK70838.1 cysteine desulfurase [Pedobacter sp. AJM]
MNQIAYLDNAATTQLDPKVLESMIPYMEEYYGNPSSIYALGRQSRLAIESSRKQVAEMLGVKATSIYFTSGGTESNNTAIAAAVNELGCTHIITSPIEHHAVLHTVEHYCQYNKLSCSLVKLNAMGEVDLPDLENQLAAYTKQGHKCLVSLMHANNEIGVLLEIEAVGVIARRHGAIFHSDCVQTIGHYPINLIDYGVHFASASGHKFHGPKGTGILYVSDGTKFGALIHGGSQERKKRAGTENVHGIIGFTKALALAMDNFLHDHSYIKSLNKRMRLGLKAISKNISFNSSENSLYTVLSVNFPAGTHTDLMLALMDRKGIYASGGSACSSGDDGGSHVITALKKDLPGATIRFSFSKMTSVEAIDFTLEFISSMLLPKDQAVIL